MGTCYVTGPPFCVAFLCSNGTRWHQFFFRRILETAWNCTQWDGRLLEQDSQESIQLNFCTKDEFWNAPEPITRLPMSRSSGPTEPWHLKPPCCASLNAMWCRKQPKLTLMKEAVNHINVCNVLVATLPNVSVGECCYVILFFGTHGPKI